MRLFLDTASVAEIREANSWGVLAGVTTNPSLVAKEGRNFHALIREICDIVPGPVSAEVVSTTAPEMIEEGKALAAIHPNVVVKVPLIPEGLKACKALSGSGIRVNVTLCFSANQGLLAALAGATFVSPFIGRLDDINHDGIQVVRDLAEIFRRHGLSCQVLAASVRHPLHVLEAARAGAHVATVPFKVLQQMVTHPLTDTGLKRFLADWEAVNKG